MPAIASAQFGPVLLGFLLHGRLSWAEENALTVAHQRAAGMTMEQLAKHFKKSIPTIRSAIGKAARLDQAVRDLPKKMPRSRWAEDHAAEVAAMKREGTSTAAIARHFRKSETTIRAALAFAK